MTDTPAPAPAPTPAPTTNWFDGLPPDDMKYVLGRGLEKGDARTAFQNMAQAYRHAESLIGHAPNSILVMPKGPEDAEGWQRFNDRLGVPKEAKDYDFAGLKFKDGSDIDEASANAIKSALLSARVPKENASTIAKALVDLADGADEGDAAAYATKLAAEREALKVDWGGNTAQNMMVVQQTAKTLGLGEEFVNTLEKTVGYTKTMQAMLKIGQAMGEDKFVMSQTGGPDAGYMSKSQAEMTLQAKMADQAWGAKLAAGDATAVKEFDTLTRVIKG